ncbi:MAG TPA: bifunctional [glutamine synthetase] adenylyltransferase/[glutamine synthetase]-adenylyl-L-tyrosine phosphorylase [Acidimicrobiales bacterium]
MDLDERIERSAAPATVRVAIEHLVARNPATALRLESDGELAGAVVAVVGASRALAIYLQRSPEALDQLADLEHRHPVDAASPTTRAAWKEREHLRLVARDLLGVDDLVATIRGVSRMARDVLDAAHALVEPPGRLAVVGMGKLGGDELNYASDIDVMFVGEGDVTALERSARRLMEVARACFRVDANLRPQGRDGPLVRTLDSYRAYWDRWAEPWEFQALLKARAVGGDVELGATFDEASAMTLWRRPFSADDLRSLRHMKARVEAQLARQGLTDREVKRGRGGIRDIEFAVQLLQLVHGRADAALRSPTTLAALDELSTAGYVDDDDARPMADAYGFLRRLEHRLQIYDGAQVYAMPTDEATRLRIARTMGLRDQADASAVEQLDGELGRHQATVRGIHERLYFRPLLEAFSTTDAELLARPGAIDERLAAFGFSDGPRTRAAIRELTRGLTRSSRLMQQMLPLLLAWLADTPDPDLGLLCLRNLTGDTQRAAALTRTFRDSPEAARRLCVLVGTSRVMADIMQRNIDLAARLPDAYELRTHAKPELVEGAGRVLGWRDDPDHQQAGLRRWKDRQLFGVMARDVLGESDFSRVGADVTLIAEAALEVALRAQEPGIPFAVIALGRFGGAELSYASDLDLVFVYDGTNASDAEEGLRIAGGLRRFVQGATPATRLWEVDVDLRPEGKQGPLARSVEGYRTYFAKWALVWERQAMLRARPVAGDRRVGAAFMDLLDDFVWEPGLSDEDRREIRRIKARVERERIPAGDDPAFHLKLGRGSLSDIEWTVQLLQLQHGVRAAGTVAGLHALAGRGLIDANDAEILAEAYRFCETTRDRLFLVRSAPGNALPSDPNQLLWLSRSLGTTPSELRDRYRRVTRRARAVMERLFYGRP